VATKLHMRGSSSGRSKAFRWTEGNGANDATSMDRGSPGHYHERGQIQISDRVTLAEIETRCQDGRYLRGVGDRAAMLTQIDMRRVFRPSTVQTTWRVVLARIASDRFASDRRLDQSDRRCSRQLCVSGWRAVLCCVCVCKFDDARLQSSKVIIVG
jgi:hypothetical protein